MTHDSKPIADNHVISTALIILGIMGAIFLSVKHLPDELWQDETYTILRFASKGFIYPFLDYHLPNNHVLFSALLAKWWGPDVSTIYLRTLPLAIFICTLCIFSFVAIRLGGKITGICALIMFGASSVTENFALQLRGYSTSWLPITLLLIALPMYAQHGRWYWGLVYVIASAASVAILPTNLVFCGIFVIWGWLQIILDSKKSFKKRSGRLMIISIGPLLGFIAYSNILINLFLHSQRKISYWNPIDLLQHWLWATFADFIWLVPFIALGLIVLLKKEPGNRDFSIGGTTSNLSLIAATFFILPIWLFVFPNPPFPRNFVPLLPVWYFLSGYLFAVAWEYLFRNRQRFSRIAFICLIASSFLVATFRLPYFGSPPKNDFPQNLRRQYYHENFFPTQTVLLLNKLLLGNRTIPIMTDLDGIYCLGFVMNNRPEIKLSLIHYKRWEALTHQYASPPHVVVTRSFAELEKMLKTVGTASQGYIEIADTGFFKIYSIRSETAERLRWAPHTENAAI